MKVNRDLKLPATSMVRERLGTGKVYKRIKALEQWAIAHGYKGYKSIQRASKEEKARQTTMRLFND